MSKDVVTACDKAGDKSVLDCFHMRCLPCMLSVKWHTAHCE